jgi:hypothetical protein
MQQHSRRISRPQSQSLSQSLSQSQSQSLLLSRPMSLHALQEQRDNFPQSYNKNIHYIRNLKRLIINLMIKQKNFGGNPNKLICIKSLHNNLHHCQQA